MEKRKPLCVDCIYKYEPESPTDFYYKSTILADLAKWGKTEFKHTFWLCKSELNNNRNHVSSKLIMKPCIRFNLNGNCRHFRTGDAIDIIEPEFELQPESANVQKDKEVILSVKIKTTTKEPTDDSEVILEEPEYKLSYQWYRNFRKYFGHTEPTLKVDTSEIGSVTYYCIVTKSIEDNGDGGKKTSSITSNEAIVEVEEPTETTDDNNQSSDD